MFFQFKSSLNVLSILLQLCGITTSVNSCTSTVGQSGAGYKAIKSERLKDFLSFNTTKVIRVKNEHSYQSNANILGLDGSGQVSLPLFKQ